MSIRIDTDNAISTLNIRQMPFLGKKICSRGNKLIFLFDPFLKIFFIFAKKPISPARIFLILFGHSLHDGFEIFDAL